MVCPDAPEEADAGACVPVPFDPDCDDDEELCVVAGVAAVDVDEALTAEPPVAAACVFCADGLGPAEACACASSWYARLVNAVGL